jgi:hypothetical protein
MELTAALATSAASAAPGEAQEQFEHGRALVKAGKPADAIPKFLASIAAEPTIAALLNLADCYERVGKLASARSRFQQAQDLAKDKDPVRADEARKRAELLLPRVSMVTLLPPPKVDGVRVWVDGVEVPSSVWGVPRPFDAGPHEIVSQDARGKRRTATIDVPASAARTTFPIDVEPEPGVVVGPPPAGATPAKGTDNKGAPPPDHMQRTLGIVVGATGLVAIAAGAVTGIIALGASSDLKSSCAAYPQCPGDRRADLADLDDRARTFSTLSTVTFISGAAVLALGTVLFLTAPSASTQGRRKAPGYAGLPLGAW